MPADIPSTPPSRIQAGDTLQWNRTLSDYPAADGWQLKYTLVSASAAHNFQATANGDAFAVVVPASTTAAWDAGRYLLTEYVTDGTQRFTLGTSDVLVVADIAAATGGVDTRSHARKVLDAIEAWLESRAPVAGEFEFNGRRVRNYDLAELLKLRDTYRAEVQREDSRRKGGRGRLLVKL